MTHSLRLAHVKLNDHLQTAACHCIGRFCQIFYKLRERTVVFHSVSHPSHFEIRDMPVSFQYSYYIILYVDWHKLEQRPFDALRCIDVRTHREFIDGVMFVFFIPVIYCIFSRRLCQDVCLTVCVIVCKEIVDREILVQMLPATHGM